MPVASIVSDLTETITSWIGDYGIYAVFILMAIDAVFPAASEVVMIYAGALAAGAFAGQTVSLFGVEIAHGFPAYLAMSLSGTVGYVVGAIVGWWIGWRGGRPYLEKHGRWLHLDHEKLERSEAWFGKYGDAAVFFGRITPVVRSFISVPAGVFRAPFGRYVVLTAIGSAIWCFLFAGIGWAAGANWEHVHHLLGRLDYLIVAAIVLGAGYLIVRRQRRKRT
jgi:membrane protein DedA with SNARE-associated domain